MDEMFIPRAAIGLALFVGVIFSAVSVLIEGIMVQYDRPIKVRARASPRAPAHGGARPPAGLAQTACDQ